MELINQRGNKIRGPEIKCKQQSLLLKTAKYEVATIYLTAYTMNT